MTNLDQQLERIKRGVTKFVSEQELRQKLSQGKSLRVKLGVDPTSPDLHLGHTVAINKLRVFQDLGHTVVFIIGDFTAAIGDPSGRDATRPPLTEDDIKSNIKTYESQVFRILDREKTEIRYNSEWLEGLFDKKNPAFLPKSLLRHHTVQQLLERDDFTERRKAGQPITVLELLYPLFQGYDSVAIKADVELGGNDQLFNLLTGRQMQKDAGQKPQVVVTLPLLEGLDGVRKMSKSFGNHIALNDAPNDMFGKVMSIPDDLMFKFYEHLTEENITEVKSQHPKEAKLRLAGLITARFHGEDKARAARDHFDNVFSQKKNPEEIEEFRLKTNGMDVVQVLLEADLAPSKNEARRLVEQGGVQLDGKRLAIGEKISLKKPAVLKVGKRQFRKLIP